MTVITVLKPCIGFVIKVLKYDVYTAACIKPPFLYLFKYLFKPFLGGC